MLKLFTLLALVCVINAASIRGKYVVMHMHIYFLPKVNALIGNEKSCFMIAKKCYDKCV